MKEKIENKQKKPWYVRVSNYFYKKDRLIARIIIILAILAYILGSAISYGVLKNKLMTPYDETYDIEFQNYLNENREDYEQLDLKRIFLLAFVPYGLIIVVIYLAICLIFMTFILLPVDVLSETWKKKHEIDFEE